MILNEEKILIIIYINAYFSIHIKTFIWPYYVNKCIFLLIYFAWT
jgi:hypothetical protein